MQIAVASAHNEHVSISEHFVHTMHKSVQNILNPIKP